MNWSKRQWKDVLSIVNGKNQKDVESDEGLYPIIGSGGTIGRAIKYLCEAGSTVVGRKGTINNPFFVDERFWNVDTAFGIQPGKSLIPKFLFYFCKGYNFKKLDKSTTIPSLAKTDLLKIEMPVPSLEEQGKIVNRIEELFSELDSAVETLKKTKEQLAVYRQSVLKEAFEGSYSDTHDQIQIEMDWADEKMVKQLPNIPKEWKYIPLSKLGVLGRGKSKHRPRNDPKLFENGKYPFLQTGDIKKAGLYVASYSKMYGDFGLAQSKLWPKGTLCITIAANIAETAFLDFDACFPDSIVGFTPNEKADSSYVRYFIQSQRLRLWAFAPATAQKNINLDTLENLIVPYCSIREQKEVVSQIESRMSVCENIEKTVNEALMQADAMRQSILKKAFEGDL